MRPMAMRGSPGKASVVLSHLGPGLTNAATGVANAALDCIPMVVIAGDVPSHYYGKHPHQEVNLHATAPSAKFIAPLSSASGGWNARNSSRKSSKRPFSWPKAVSPDRCWWMCPWISFPRRWIPRFSTASAQHQELRKPSMDEETAEEIVDHLAGGQKPVIYVGGGVMLAKAAERIARSWSITSASRWPTA